MTSETSEHDFRSISCTLCYLMLTKRERKLGFPRGWGIESVWPPFVVFSPIVFLHGFLCGHFSVIPYPWPVKHSSCAKIYSRAQNPIPKHRISYYVVLFF